LHHEISKNTFLENGETYKLEYKADENETLKLISPDDKIITSFKMEKEVVKNEVKEEKNIKGSSQEKEEIEIKSENEIQENDLKTNS
jgi:hypothetical protein